MSSKNLTCRNCGKKSHKKTIYHSNFNGEWDHLFDKDLNYVGNQIMTNKLVAPTNDVLKIISFNLWDGETYELKYGNFCTLRCGLEFANKVLNKYNIPEGEL
tara:strand:- start:59 stop:364 length:306 start_codon:yes stop_codon:yes gene_type:complete